MSRQEEIKEVQKVQYCIKNTILALESLDMEVLSSEHQKLNQLSVTLKEVLIMLQNIIKRE